MGSSYRLVKSDGSRIHNLYEIGIPHSLCALLDCGPGSYVLIKGEHTNASFMGIVRLLPVDISPTDRYVEIHEAVLASINLDYTDTVKIKPIVKRLDIAAEIKIKLVDCIVDDEKQEFERFAAAILRSIRFISSTSLSLQYWGRKQLIDICEVTNLSGNSVEEDFFEVDDLTKFKFVSLSAPVKPKSSKESNKVMYKDIGGLDTQLKFIREFIEFPLKKPEIYNDYGIKAPKGILLKGPPGTGKTMLIKAISNELNVFHKAISGPELLSKYYGETETKLKSVFDECLDNSPSLLFIDEIDSICPKRQVASELESRIITTLLTLMDGISTDSNKPLIVIGCTNKPDNLDSAIRRPGRFDKEITIDIPSPKGRLDILRRMISKLPNTLSDDDLNTIVDHTHGFVGSDLAYLIRLSSFLTIKKFTKTQLLEKDEPYLTIDDINSTIPSIRPSAIREVTLEVPKVKWTDIGGNETIKERLIEAIYTPLEKQNLYDKFGIKPPKGILLYGPPGCSKTLLAKAIATECNQNFLAVKGPELFSKWVGESEKSVRELFRKARASAPSIIFFDEIDSIATKRAQSGGTSVSDRVLVQLLSEIDGIEGLKGVTIIAATNRPDVIDDALMRPGRIDRILYVPPPNDDARKQIYINNFKKMSVDKDISIDLLVKMTEGYSGAECVQLCQEAAICALDEDISAEYIKMKHFEQGYSSIKRQIIPEMLEYYDSYKQKSKLNVI